MLGHKGRDQPELFITGSLEQLVPEDHVLARVDRVLDLGWLREEVADCYCLDNGRPGIDPEVAVRLMLAGLLLRIVHDRRLMREAQVNIAIRWFIGYGLHERLHDHSSLTRIRQRWGEERFREIFRRTVTACLDAKIATAEIVHIDASLIRADVSWESLVERHADEVMAENRSEEEIEAEKKTRRSGKYKKVSLTDEDASMATSARNQRLEPCYKQHTAVDDARGVVLDVAVTTGEVNEGETIEAQVDAVQEIADRAITTVTGDAGYAYAKVYGALERRGIDPLIPAKKEPIKSRVTQLSRGRTCTGGSTKGASNSPWWSVAWRRPGQIHGAVRGCSKPRFFGRRNEVPGCMISLIESKRRHDGDGNSQAGSTRQLRGEGMGEMARTARPYLYNTKPS